LEKTNGTIIYEQSEILKESEIFYKTLYTKTDSPHDFNMEEFLGNITVQKLSRNQADSLEGLFTFEEISENFRI
jgi:hypothetical protein